MVAKTPDVGDQQATFTPDVFIIPGQVMLDPNLQPLDSKVYAAVYWFERLKDGRCFASNAAISKIVGSSSNGVNNSLSRLRGAGYLICTYDDQKHRTSISTLVKMHKGTSNEVGGVPETRYRDNNTKGNSSYSAEEKEQALKLHKTYIRLFKVDSDDLAYADQEQKLTLLRKALANYKLTDKRLSKVVPRLRDAGYDMCHAAIVNAAKNPWNHGENDRAWKLDLYDYLFRNYEQVEKWANQ